MCNYTKKPIPEYTYQSPPPHIYLTMYSFDTLFYESNLLFFFFSSRRRHTRCGRDWSSDVCSSDLCGFNTGITQCQMEPAPGCQNRSTIHAAAKHAGLVINIWCKWKLQAQLPVVPGYYLCAHGAAERNVLFKHPGQMCGCVKHEENSIAELVPGSIANLAASFLPGQVNFSKPHCLMG